MRRYPWVLLFYWIILNLPCRWLPICRIEEIHLINAIWGQKSHHGDICGGVLTVLDKIPVLSLLCKAFGVGAFIPAGFHRGYPVNVLFLCGCTDTDISRTQWLVSKRDLFWSAQVFIIRVLCPWRNTNMLLWDLNSRQLDQKPFHQKSGMQSTFYWWYPVCASFFEELGLVKIISYYWTWAMWCWATAACLSRSCMSNLGR